MRPGLDLKKDRGFPFIYSAIHGLTTSTVGHNVLSIGGIRQIAQSRGTHRGRRSNISGGGGGSYGEKTIKMMKRSH